MKPYRALCCFLFVLSLSPSIGAQVQDTSNAVESVDEQARARAAELANEASDLFGRELYGAALEAFVKAYQKASLEHQVERLPLFDADHREKTCLESAC